MSENRTGPDSQAPEEGRTLGTRPLAGMGMAWSEPTRRRLLTREEVDLLLGQVQNSELQADRERRGVPIGKGSPVAVYDFKHPNRVSKEQVRKLELIHDHFAGTLASSLSTSQRSIVDVDLESVEQVTYTEFIGSLNAPACSYTYRMPPLEGLCVVDFHPGLALAIVDRVFGGRGAAPDLWRELTGIERSVMSGIVTRVLGLLAESWDRILASRAEAVDFQAHPQFMQIVPPGETVIVVSLRVSMPAAGGLLKVCYPHVALESVLGRLAAQNWLESTRSTRATSTPSEILCAIRQMQVPVDGLLAETRIAMRDLVALETGMVIPLPVRVGEPVVLRVGGRKKFKGTLGLVGRRRALKIEIPNSDGRC